MSLAAGSKLGPYEIGAAIGAGGMGEVFRARDTKLNRDVAIKVLPAAFAQDHERVARFKREAQVLASLNHPNIAAIYGLEESAGVVALVLELALGEDLAQRLSRGAVPVDESVAIARQIAEALEEAHEHGVVHRDLKPANVTITRDGKVKVLDFGLAKALDVEAGGNSGSSQLSHSPTMSRHATEAGIILGTAAYMSPEQARGKPLDKRTDIWAFGVVLYEMLTGERLFAGETVSDVLAAVLTRDLSLKTLPATAPAALRSLLHECLTRDPKLRLRDIGDARIALDHIIKGDAPIAAASKDRPRAWLWPALFALALLAAVFGFALGRRTASTKVTWTFSGRTYASQAIFNARFMPDGQTLIYSAALTGTSPSLYESRSGDAAPRAFGPARTHLLSISKSGELLVITNADYIHQRLFGGTLARMTLDGAPRAIAEDVREADWLPDGSDFAVVRDTDQGDQLEFPAGHVVHRVAAYLSDPKVSPDGTRLAFMEHPAKYDDRGFVKVVDRSGAVTTLAGEFVAEEGITWSPDGREIRFAGVIGRGDATIFSVPASGVTPATPLISSPGNLYMHDVTPDGRLAITREGYRSGVIARGAGQTEERDLTPFDQSWSPILSADGKTLVFSDGRGGADYVIDQRGVDGSPPERLGDGNVSGLSLDGRWVAATLFSTNRCVVYPTGAGPLVEIPMGPLEKCHSASWFPDSKSLLIFGSERGKPITAYRAAFPGGLPQPLPFKGVSPQQISSGSASARLSSDGTRFLSRDAKDDWRIFEMSGRTTPVKGLSGADAVIEWPEGGANVISAFGPQIPKQIFRVNIESGARTQLGELSPFDHAGLLRVIPVAWRDGGRQYAYTYTRQTSMLYLATPSR